MYCYRFEPKSELLYMLYASSLVLIHVQYMPVQNANMIVFTCILSIVPYFFLCAALVDLGVSEQWTSPNGESTSPRLTLKVKNFL